jgi:MFS family permease
MQNLSKFPQIIILMVMFSFLSLAAIVFTPAYPLLAKELHLKSSDAQWMMTLFLLGTAIGRLPYGPLANRFGRKNTLFLGLFISLVGTGFILIFDNYALICIGRFIQALGCAVTLKIGYTMIADVHAGAATTKILSYSMLIYAILPAIGANVTGILIDSFGWRGGFGFFLLFTIVFMLFCLCLPETLKVKQLEALKIKNIAQGYLRQLKNPSLVLWGCLMGLSTAIIFIFSQEAPFIGIDLIGLSPEQYALFYLIPSCGIAVGSLLTIWLSDRMSSLMGMFVGIIIIAVSSICMWVFFLVKWTNGLSLFLPQAIMQLGDAILYTFASSEGLSQAKDKSNASAVMLFITGLGAVAGTFLVGELIPASLMGLTVAFILISFLMLIIWIVLFFLKKRAERRF